MWSIVILGYAALSEAGLGDMPNTFPGSQYAPPKFNSKSPWKWMEDDPASFWDGLFLEPM